GRWGADRDRALAGSHLQPTAPAFGHRHAEPRRLRGAVLGSPRSGLTRVSTRPGQDQSIRIGLGHGRGVAHLGLGAPSLAEPAISSFGRPYIVARFLYLPLQAQGDAHETEKGCLGASAG